MISKRYVSWSCRVSLLLLLCLDPLACAAASPSAAAKQSGQVEQVHIVTPATPLSVTPDKKPSTAQEPPSLLIDALLQPNRSAVDQSPISQPAAASGRAMRSGGGGGDAHDDYPSAHSAPDYSLYPAGHSAPSGYGHDHDDAHAYDTHGKPAHYYHPSATGLENYAYDPNIHNTFVHSYADEMPHIPHYLVPASAVAAAGPWAASQPAAAISVHDYLLHSPADPSASTPTAASTTATAAATAAATTTADPTAAVVDPMAGVAGLLAAVVPRSVALLLFRSVSFLLSTVAVVVFGGVLTSAVCALTPLCTITFLPWWVLRQSASNSLKYVMGVGAGGAENLVHAAAAGAAVGELLGGSDGGGSGAVANSSSANNSSAVVVSRIARAARMLGSAMVKYQAMQAEVAQPASGGGE